MLPSVKEWQHFVTGRGESKKTILNNKRSQIKPFVDAMKAVSDPNKALVYEKTNLGKKQRC